MAPFATSNYSWRKLSFQSESANHYLYLFKPLVTGLYQHLSHGHTSSNHEQSFWGTYFTSKPYISGVLAQIFLPKSGHWRCITLVTSQPLSCPTSALPGVLFLHPLRFPPKPNQPSQTFKIGIDELRTLPKRHGFFESQSWHCQIFSNLLHPIKMCGWLSPKHSQIANKKSCKPHGIMASTCI